MINTGTSRMQLDFLVANNPKEYNRMKSSMLFRFRDKVMKTRDSQTESVHDQWKIQHKNHVSKLSLVVLIYLFNQDDGVISKLERKIIKKTTKKSVQFLTYEEYTGLSTVIEALPDVDYVISYIKDHNMKENTVRESVAYISTLIGSNPLYTQLIKNFETKYITSK